MRIQKVIRRGVVAATLAGTLLAAPLTSASASRPLAIPASPANVSLTSGNKQLAATWTETSGGTIVFTATAKSPGRAAKSCKTKKLLCSITGLVNGVVYDVTVVAKNASGVSSPSSDTTATVGVPGAPQSVRATPTIASAVVTWGPPAASGVAKITGYMATASPGGYSCSTASTVVSAPGRTCVIAGLSSGITYTVTVTATNAFGTSFPSKPATVTPD